MKYDRPFVSAIVLAAGASSRMGEPNKLLMRLNGKSVLRVSVENALKANINEVLVEAGQQMNETILELKQLHVNVVVNRNHPLGISTSIVAGIRAVNPNAEAALILLADQPNLRPQTINELVEKFKTNERKIAVARYDGVLGNPVIFHRDLFPELLEIEGDVGARSVLQKHPDELIVVDIPKEESLDIDTREDFEVLKRLYQQQELPASQS